MMEMKMISMFCMMILMMMKDEEDLNMNESLRFLYQ